MAFGGFNDNNRNAPMADINVTPMVDVMLVLLVIFIITAPMFTHAIKLELPAAKAAPAPEKPATITVSIDGGGRLFWNDKPVELADMGARLETESKKDPQPELQLRADKATRYETIAQVMATAQGSGMTKLGFVTDPKSANAAAATAK